MFHMKGQKEGQRDMMKLIVISRNIVKTPNKTSKHYYLSMSEQALLPLEFHSILTPSSF